MIELALAVLAVLLCSGLCSGAEAALLSVPTLRARQLAESGGKRAVALLRIREGMVRPIAAIVVLNNIANIVGSITVGTMAARILGSQWIGLFSGVLTLLVIIAAEIIPKTLGFRYAEQVGLWASRPLLWITGLLTPLLWMIEQITAMVVPAGERRTTNEEEIKLLARMGAREGDLETTESEIVERAFNLHDQTASDIMTPRVAMTFLHADRTLAEVKDAVLNSQHSRIITIGQDVDDVKGVVLKDELLQALVLGQESDTVESLDQDVAFIPESMRTDVLLKRFLGTRQQLMVVVDEFGGVAGVVSLEDVLETITGEIVDETDRVVDLARSARSVAPRGV